jgi:hypothetical protein
MHAMGHTHMHMLKFNSRVARDNIKKVLKIWIWIWIVHDFLSYYCPEGGQHACVVCTVTTIMTRAPHSSIFKGATACTQI